MQPKAWAAAVMATNWETWPPWHVEAGLPTARLVVGQPRRCDGREAEQGQSIWDDLLLMCKTRPPRHVSRQRLHARVVSRRPSLHHGRHHRVPGTPNDVAVVIAADVHIPLRLRAARDQRRRRGGHLRHGTPVRSLLCRQQGCQGRARHGRRQVDGVDLGEDVRDVLLRGVVGDLGHARLRRRQDRAQLQRTRHRTRRPRRRRAGSRRHLGPLIDGSARELGWRRLRRAVLAKMVLGPTAPATGRPAHGVKATIDKVLLVLVVDAARSRKASGQDVGIAVIKVTRRADAGELRQPPPAPMALPAALRDASATRAVQHACILLKRPG